MTTESDDPGPNADADFDPEFERMLERVRKMTPAQRARILARERKRRRDEIRLQALCLKRALSPAEPQAAAFASALGLLKLAGQAEDLIGILAEHFDETEDFEILKAQREEAAIAAMTGEGTEEEEPPPVH